MKPRYDRICISIIPSSIDDLIKKLRVLPKEPYIEIRFDNLIDIESAIEHIPDEITERCIFTVRTVREGGWFNGSTNRLYNLYLNLIDLGPRYIDVGIDTGILKDVVYIAHRKGISVIGSYHNAETTPNKDELEKIYRRLVYNGVDAVKIVCTAKNHRDNCRMVEFLLNTLGEKPITAFNMGELGRITRYLNLLLGGFMTYTSLGSEKTAPGQIEYHEMISLYRGFIGDS